MNERTIRITLTSSELETFSLSGYARRVSGLREGFQRQPWRRDLGFDHDLMGCLSEAAWARHLNIFYAPTIGSTDSDTGDVAGQYQIRSSINPYAHLPVKLKDKDQFPYLLAIIKLPHVEFVGWMFGHEAKQNPKNWQPVDLKRNINEAAYWIKQADLHPMSTVPTLVR